MVDPEVVATAWIGRAPQALKGKGRGMGVAWGYARPGEGSGDGAVLPPLKNVCKLRAEKVKFGAYFKNMHQTKKCTKILFLYIFMACTLQIRRREWLGLLLFV